MENGNRTQSVDIAKGILIILVVVAHAQADIVHDLSLYSTCHFSS